MRKIAATYVFPCSAPPIKNGILVCEDNGTIVDVIQPEGELREESGLEFYSGILAPGFVNAHCHLELSHLKNKIEENTGIGGFIGKINQLRNEDTGAVTKLIEIADRKMRANGIVAVGDISNSTLTIETKVKSKVYYHTFIESFGFHPTRADRAFEYANFILNEFERNNLSSSIAPHSPYSVSDLLFKKIFKKAFAAQSLLTIHNQESLGESAFYKEGTGPVLEHLQVNLGIDTSHWKPTGKSSLKSIIDKFPAENQLLLVHNTFTEKSDLDEIRKVRSLLNTYLVLCPNSNLYIENQLPPVDLFLSENVNICYGTDSLASNHKLSVLDELITIQNNFPELDMENLLKQACLVGARALQVEENYGSFEKGKSPGVNLLTGIDFRGMRFTKNSKVKRLI